MVPICASCRVIVFEIVRGCDLVIRGVRVRFLRVFDGEWLIVLASMLGEELTVEDDESGTEEIVLLLDMTLENVTLVDVWLAFDRLMLPLGRSGSSRNTMKMRSEALYDDVLGPLSVAILLRSNAGSPPSAAHA